MKQGRLKKLKKMKGEIVDDDTSTFFYTVHIRPSFVLKL